MARVKLSELIDAVDFAREEEVCHVDLETGEVVYLSQALLDAVAEGDEAAFPSLAEWERRNIAVAREIAADSGSRFVQPPGKFDFHEYEHMEKFIETGHDAAAAESLRRAIQGKGAFRRFKDTAGRLGLLNAWYAYREVALKQYLLNWAAAYHVPVTDDTVEQPDGSNQPDHAPDDFDSCAS